MASTIQRGASELADSPPSSDPFEQLGAALRILRLRQGLSQTSLAQRCGLTPPMISNYERGANVPSVHSLGRLLDAMAIDLYELADALSTVQGRTPRAVGGPRADQLENVVMHYLKEFQGKPRRRRALVRALAVLAEALQTAE
ncbi:MAG: helix-turn-helix transcriptional regulator [Acidobacteriota bacterium]